jgi:uncharacterized protein YjaG (DUF416 family)
MIPVFRFDQADLTRKLDQLLPSLRTIFAASCAERLLPAYATFSYFAKQGEPETIERSLARLWEDIAGDSMTGDELQESIDACTALIPYDNDMSTNTETAYAEDAASAVVYSLTCRQNGNSKEAMWSAQCVCEAVGYFATHRQEVDVKPGAASRVYTHPLIQAELARQCRDMDELLAIDDEDLRQIAARFRVRAKAESKVFFGAPS